MAQPKEYFKMNLPQQEYNELSPIQRDAYDALHEADRGQKSMVWDTIRRYMYKDRDGVLFLISWLNKGYEEAPDAMLSFIGHLACGAVVAAAANSCQCDGYCYHQQPG